MRPKLTLDEHENVVRVIAATRFPFPDQKQPYWPIDYVTTINTATHKRNGILVDGEMHYPDLLVFDGRGDAREIAEVETDVSPEYINRWRAASEYVAERVNEPRHLLIYVPAGLEQEAEQLLIENGISYYAIRGVEVSEDGAVHILPYRTFGSGKDHRFQVPPPIDDDQALVAPDEAAHWDVVRFVAYNRFPFVYQTSDEWPLDYHTYTNTENHRRIAVERDGVLRFPDIVVVNGAGQIQETGEVETDIGPACVERWRLCSQCSPLGRTHIDPANGCNAPRFFVYAPSGQEDAAEDILRSERIGCAGVRGYSVTRSGRVTITSERSPIAPPAD